MAEMRRRVEELQNDLSSQSIMAGLAQDANRLSNEESQFHSEIMAKMRRAEAELMAKIASRGQDSTYELGPQGQKVVKIMREHPYLVPKIREFSEDILAEVQAKLAEILQAREFQPDQPGESK